MKAILVIPTLIMCFGCMHHKKEEMINLKINTASALKGRTIEGNIRIDNGEDAEILRD